MEKSESIKELATALCIFQSEVETVQKSATNPFFKSKYADLPAILDVIRKPLSSAGLSFVQFPTGKYGLTTILMHESGEFISECYEMHPTKDDPQGAGSVITYQRRYALGAILGLSIDVDDDGNAASQPNEKTKAVAAATPEMKQEDARPWLTEKAKLQACKRIADGEPEIYQKTIDAFKMKKEYRKELEETFETFKNMGNGSTISNQ